jgi:hypothetical protein
MKPPENIAAATANPSSVNEFPTMKETPAPVTNAVPTIKWRTSVLLKRTPCERGERSTLRVPAASCIGDDAALADLTAFTRHVSLHS